MRNTKTKSQVSPESSKSRSTTNNNKRREDRGLSPDQTQLTKQRTYAPPRVTARHEADNKIDDIESGQKLQPNRDSLRKDEASPVAKEDGGGSAGTPGVDRPPEKVFFPKRKVASPTKSDRRQRDTRLNPSDNSLVQSQSSYSKRRTDDDTADSVTIDSYLEATAKRQQRRMDKRAAVAAVRVRNEKRSGKMAAMSPRKASTKYSSRTRSPETTLSEESEESEFIDEAGTANGSVSVYHLAHDEIKPPSPKHRRKLNAWYESQTSRSSEADPESQTTRHQRRTRGKRSSRRSRSREREGVFSSLFGMTDRTDEESEYTDPHQDEPSGVFNLGSTEFSTEGLGSGTSFFNETVLGEEDYLKTKQETAWMSIGLTSIQLLILCLQLAMCGIAGFDINPFIGPYPDVFSEWGGKNAYLMIQKNQWFRLVSPALLHVGVLHLLANAFCQLEPIALFEREWGSLRWTILYLLSAVGCTSVSSLVDPDTIAVGSSGALMGLFAAKLAQVTSHIFFEVNKTNQDGLVRLDQLSSVICGLVLVSLLSFFTFIDWSGHMGGLATGFFGGMLFFCNPIRSSCWKFLWGFIGLCGVAGCLSYTFYSMLYEAEAADEELGDACEYFRYFFPEGYECGCLSW